MNITNRDRLYDDVPPTTLLEERVKELEDIVSILISEVESLRKANIYNDKTFVRMDSFKDAIDVEYERLDPNAKDFDLAENG